MHDYTFKHEVLLNPRMGGTQVNSESCRGLCWGPTPYEGSNKQSRFVMEYTGTQVFGGTEAKTEACQGLRRCPTQYEGTGVLHNKP